ncbi:MAG: anti-sigma factor [Microscillaceae bacterium]|nr:anti-sigma factor [Microscillaceae bacterium]
MNIREYIESGIIESYVLGATSPEENEEVEKLAKNHPEIQMEIEASKVALVEYIMQFQAEPPANLKNKVMEKLAFLEEEEQEEEIRHEIKRISQTSKGLQIWIPYLAAACLVLLLVSLGFNVLLYNNWQKTKKELALAESQQQILASDIKSLKANYTQVNKELAILKDPYNTYIELQSASEEAPDAKVALIWNKQTREVYLHVKNLPQPPPGKQYQLWSVDGEKVADAGVFDVSSEKILIQKMKNVSRANTFIITLEKEGGVQVAEGKAYAKGDV